MNKINLLATLISVLILPTAHATNWSGSCLGEQRAEISIKPWGEFVYLVVKLNGETVYDFSAAVDTVNPERQKVLVHGVDVRNSNSIKLNIIRGADQHTGPSWLKLNGSDYILLSDCALDLKED